MINNINKYKIHGCLHKKETIMKDYKTIDKRYNYLKFNIKQFGSCKHGKKLNKQKLE